MSETVITKEILMAVNYGVDLKNKFKEIGVEAAWKAGKKKEELIDSALVMLTQAKALKEQGTDETDVDAALKLKEAKDAEDKEKEEVRKSELIEKAAKVVSKSLEDIVASLSSEILESNLINIESNMRLNIPAQRDTLLNKKHIIQAELEKRKESE